MNKKITVCTIPTAATAHALFKSNVPKSKYSRKGLIKTKQLAEIIFKTAAVIKILFLNIFFIYRAEFAKHDII